MKPKKNQTDIPAKDRCQTPAYGVTPLLPYLPKDAVLWESAAGEGFLAAALVAAGHRAVLSDVLTGQNFFHYQPGAWDVQVTNPPYSLKFAWIKHSYELGKPFALLMPVEAIGAQTAQRLFSRYGVEVIWLDKRVNFKMPNTGWDGAGAQFPVAWFTWGLNIGTQMTFYETQPINQPRLFEVMP